MHFEEELKQRGPTAARIIERADELGADAFDYESALWLFSPAGKVFEFGDLKLHYIQYEYGFERSEFMRQALAGVHPHAQPEFYPCSKIDAYRDALELMERELEDCEEPECAFCLFRQQLPPAADRLERLARFCVEDLSWG